MRINLEKVLFLVPPTIDFQKFKNPPIYVRALPKKDGLYGSVLTDMPLGVLALSAYIKKHCDVVVDVIDFNVPLNKVDEFPYDNFFDFFKDYISKHVSENFTPTLIGISTLFRTSYTNMMDIARACKELFPDQLIFAGGGVPTNMYDKIFKETSDIDIMLFGEGERALAGYINSNDKAKFLQDYPCIITREKVDNKTVFVHDFIDDLDEIPLYDYGMLDLSDYRLNPTISAYPGMDSSKPHVTFMSSRGCPFLCTFCSAHSVHGRKMRYYSLDRVKEDIRILQEEFGTETIIFQDDHFMADKKRVHEILAYMRERGMTAFFPNALTLYALDRPMLEALQGVGVKVMIMAVESGSQRVLKEVMKKPLNQKIQRQVFKDCRELGIDTDVNIIIGMPGEKKEDIEDARKFLKELYGTWFRIYAAVPLEGSDMYKEAVAKGYLTDGYINGDFKKAVIETEDWTSEYIQHACYSLNLDLNFITNSEMRVGNYERALKEFENTISVKDDHAFAYYFASKCHEKLGNYEKAVEYDKKFTDIMEVSEFWRDWAAEFNFKPEKLVFDEKETNGDTPLAASDPRLPNVPKDTDPKMLGNSAGWGTM